MSREEDIKNLLVVNNRHLQKLKEQAAKFGVHTPAFILTEIEDKEAEIEKLQTELNSIADLPVKITQENSSKYRYLLSISVIIFIVLASLVVLRSSLTTPSPLFTSLVLTDVPTDLIDSPSATPQLLTPDIQISSTSTISDIYIADWSGPQSYLSEELLVFQKSCKDEQGFSSALGSSPAYFVILETWIGLTFVNPNTIPTGIIRIEPIYNTDYERQWQLNVWYVTMYESDDLKEVIAPPIELPPNTPVKRYFRAIHVAGVHPDISALAVYEYADEELSPLRWTFTALGDSQIIHISELQQYAPEALDDGKFKFKENCTDILPDWPVPIPGRSIGKGK